MYSVFVKKPVTQIHGGGFVDFYEQKQNTVCFELGLATSPGWLRCCGTKTIGVELVMRTAVSKIDIPLAFSDNLPVTTTAMC